MAAKTLLERRNHTLERRLERTSEPLCALWHNLGNDLVQQRLGVMSVHQCLRESTREILE